MNWRDEPYSCGSCHNNHKKYQLVLMDAEGKITTGRTFDSWDEVHDAMIEMRVLYAKHEINYHVGYMEV